MKLFLVTFTLDSSRRANVETILKSAKMWWHYLDTVWIIGTDQPLSYWHAQIKSKLISSDSLFMVDVTNKERNGWLPQKAWAWLNSVESECNKTDLMGSGVKN